MRRSLNGGYFQKYVSIVGSGGSIAQKNSSILPKSVVTRIKKAVADEDWEIAYRLTKLLDDFYNGKEPITITVQSRW